MSEEVVNSSTGKKKPPFVFYIILIALPVLFMVALEVGLRLLNYGNDYQLFQERDDAVDGVIYVNPNISYKYFGNLSSTVFNAEVGFYKDKPERSFRVFVLGGSSTQGFPYNQQASFPGHLKRRLELLYPNKFIEVINLGASAINSYTIRDILPDVLDQSPDLILIYTGHNEYYGALGAGSSKSVNPALANLLLYLRDFRTVQLLENLIAKASKEASSQDKNLMQKMIGQSLIEYESTTYRRGIIQYEDNLSAILKVIQKSKVPAIIGTLTSNISDQKPFNSKQVSKEGLSANDYFNQGKELFALGNYDEARDNFIMAKEYDGLRFRAPEEINKVIQDKAKEYEIPVVDIEKIFNEKSPGNSTGANLMCDHLHPNLQGYFLMSKIFAMQF
jgi:lysophospholipase L1-like esterase